MTLVVEELFSWGSVSSCPDSSIVHPNVAANVSGFEEIEPSSRTKVIIWESAYFNLVICRWNPVLPEQDFKFSVFGVIPN